MKKEKHTKKVTDQKQKRISQPIVSNIEPKEDSQSRSKGEKLNFKKVLFDMAVNMKNGAQFQDDLNQFTSIFQKAQ